MSTGSNTSTTEEITINRSDLSLRQSIQIEMLEEAVFEKRKQAFIKKFLKQHSNRKYKIVVNIKDADLIILLNKYDISKYVIIVNDNNKEIVPEEGKDIYTEIYLKNKNPRDRKLNTIGDLTSTSGRMQITTKNFFSEGKNSIEINDT